MPMNHVIRLKDNGLLELEKRPINEVSNVPDGVLVKVRAFGINRADLLQRAGHYPAPPNAPQDVLGLEFAGEIVELGPKLNHSSKWQIGDRVMGICSGGGYATHLITSSDLLLPIPLGVSFESAAAIPEVYLTAFDALRHIAKLKSGERVLIHAIGSGVGLAAARLAKWMGAEVIGTSRSPWKLKRAHSTLDLSSTWLSKDGVFLSKSDRNSVDVVIDFIGAAYLQQNLNALRNQGRLVIVGLLGGAKASIPLGTVLARRLEIYGTVLRSRSEEEKIKLTHSFITTAIDSLGSKIALPEVDEVFDASNPQEIDRAHERLKNNQVWSKLVAQWPSVD